jgi:hypothetical protein
MCYYTSPAWHLYAALVLQLAVENKSTLRNSHIFNHYTYTDYSGTVHN